MTTQEISTRLKSLSDSNRDISQLISKLSKLSSSSEAGIDESEVRVELSSEIHQSLKELEEDFELVRQEAEEVANSASWSSGARRKEGEKERDRVNIITQTERLKEDLKLARAQFRKAQLQAKRNEEAFKRKEREQLFAGIQEGNRTASGRRRGQEKLSPDDLIVNASSDVTAALRRTHQLMQSELQRSQFAHETLQRSTTALNSLNESYSTLDTLLSSSKSLISTLVSSQKSDTWYLETAFWILVYTIAWLAFRRLFYGPIRYLLYLPLKWSLQLSLSILQLFVSIFTGSSAKGLQSSASSSSSRSLIVKPSATGRPPTINPNMPAPSVRVGAGGAGAKQDPNSNQEGASSTPLSDRVGQMAEDSRQQQRRSAQGSRAGSKDEGREGGNAGSEQRGTVLRERREDEAPNPKKRMWEEAPNPKKRMWEEPAPENEDDDAEEEEGEDDEEEEEEVVRGPKGGGRVRDEL